MVSGFLAKNESSKSIYKSRNTHTHKKTQRKRLQDDLQENAIALNAIELNAVSKQFISHLSVFLSNLLNVKFFDIQLLYYLFVLPY